MGRHALQTRPPHSRSSPTERDPKSVSCILDTGLVKSLVVIETLEAAVSLALAGQP